MSITEATSITAVTEDVSPASGPARGGGAREALVVAVLLYGLTRSVEALAGDPCTKALEDLQPIVGGTPLSLAFVPDKSRTGEAQFSSMEFGRQKTSMATATAPAAPESSYEVQPLRSTSAWQRLADYRSQGRVQLLTLWQSPRSTVSLQAGKHGGPSLQWSSRLMNRGGATRGLLDHFVASSLGAAAFGPKFVSRSSGAAPSNKTVTPVPAFKTP